MLPIRGLRPLSRSIGCRTFTSSPMHHRELKDKEDIMAFLTSSSWSVRSLLPAASDTTSQNEVTPKQLHHLLRLSALPPPATPEQEASMLRDLHAQLHFVKQIQRVNTEGVEPLQALRGENKSIQSDGKVQGEIGLDEMRNALAAEEVVGKHHKRIRRRKNLIDEEAKKAEDWDVLGQAGKKVGRYFVVESERTKDTNG